MERAAETRSPEKPASERGFTRREVLRKAALAAGGALAVPFIAPARALGRGGAAAPSERIGMGFIGIGRMGQGHHRCFLEYADVQILGVCDVDRWRRENAKAATEAAYGAASGGAYKGCEAYRDLRELLARDDIDAVLVATGDRWHVTACALAARAGKDIYCEKPQSITIDESRSIVKIVREYGRVFQTGLQQRSTAEFVYACDRVRRGRIGAVKHVYVCFPGTVDYVDLPAEPVPDGLDWDLWIGPAPWHPFNNRFHQYGQPRDVVPWHFTRDFGGGNLTSNAVHAFDVVQWALGMDRSGPVEIVPPGATDRELGPVPSLTYRYESGTVLQVDWKLDPAKHFVPKGWDPNTPIENFGALYIGEEGWIHVGRQGYLQSWPESLIEDRPKEVDQGRPVPDHHRNWLDCIRTRRLPVCEVAIGCQSTTVSHLGCIAHWTGRPLRWDPEKAEFLGDEEANRLRSRAKREPWRV